MWPPVDVQRENGSSSSLRNDPRHAPSRASVLLCTILVGEAVDRSGARHRQVDHQPGASYGRRFAAIFACPAADRERQRKQAPSRDLAITLNTASVLAVV